MAANDIVTATDVYGQAPDTEGTDTTLVSAVITSISDAIEDRCGRRIIEADYSAWHSGNRALDYGDRAYGVCPRCVLYLADPATGYVTNPVTTVTSITEDGIALNVILSTTSATFPSGDGAWVSLADGIVRRCYVSNGKLTWQSWNTGTANIRIVYHAGYAQASVPDRIKQAAIEWIWIALRETRRSGIDSYSADGGSASYGRLLMPTTKAILDAFAYPRTPVTVER